MRYRQAIKKLLSLVLPPGQFLTRGDASCRPVGLDGGIIPISLTFDDGPDPRWTRPVLDALDEANWTGTFFVIGRKAEAHPHLVCEIVERGHEIGNHSYAHREPEEIGAREFLRGVVRTQRLLSAMTGETIALMRPPKGKLDVSKTLALWRCRQSVVLWNVDPRDYQMASIEEAQDWAGHYLPSAGDIVLLHDRFRYAAEIIRTLANQLGGRIRSVGISDWLESGSTGGQHDVNPFPGKLINS